MTSLQRLLTAALAAALLLPRRGPRLLLDGDRDRRRRGAAQRAQRRQGGRRGRRRGPRWGSTTCGSSFNGSASPPANSEVKAPDGFDSAESGQPGLRLVARGPGRRAWSAPPGMRPLLVVTGPGPLWASQVPARHRPALQAATRPLRPVRARGGAALRRGRRPLDHLERAQPAAVAAAAEHVRGQALHAVRAAPLPAARARRLPGDQGGRPHLDRPLRRPRAARRERRRSRTPARCRWPSSVRWGASRSPSSAIAPGRARAFSRSAATDFAYHPHATTRAPDRAAARSSTRRRSPTCRAWSARSTRTQRAGGLKKAGRRQVRALLHRVGLPDAPARPDPGRAR